jgi:RNA-splicing ligase RtcB
MVITKEQLLKRKRTDETKEEPESKKEKLEISKETKEPSEYSSVDIILKDEFEEEFEKALREQSDEPEERHPKERNDRKTIEENGNRNYYEPRTRQYRQYERRRNDTYNRSNGRSESREPRAVTIVLGTIFEQLSILQESGDEHSRTYDKLRHTAKILYKYMGETLGTL